MLITLVCESKFDSRYFHFDELCCADLKNVFDFVPCCKDSLQIRRHEKFIFSCLVVFVYHVPMSRSLLEHTKVLKQINWY
jgi:hypothetical protein